MVNPVIEICAKAAYAEVVWDPSDWPDLALSVDADVFRDCVRAVFKELPGPLFEAIKHGDEAHQAWLMAKLQEFFNG